MMVIRAVDMVNATSISIPVIPNYTRVPFGAPGGTRTHDQGFMRPLL